MTTIAWDGKSLAGDRMISFGNHTATGATKINRTPDGRLIGAAGHATSCEAVMLWLQLPDYERGALPACQLVEDEFATALEVLKNGRLIIHQMGIGFEVDAPFAYGSGADLAIGSMASGKSAGYAVGIASQFDAGTGGGVDVLKLR